MRHDSQTENIIGGDREGHVERRRPISEEYVKQITVDVGKDRFEKPKELGYLLEGDTENRNKPMKRLRSRRREYHNDMCVILSENV